MYTVFKLKDLTDKYGERRVDINKLEEILEPSDRFNPYRWEPIVGEEVYILNNDGEIYSEIVTKEDKYLKLLSFGNVAPHSDEGRAYLTEKAWADEFAHTLKIASFGDGYVPDYKDNKKMRWHIDVSDGKEVCAMSTHGYSGGGYGCFDSEKLAKDFIKRNHHRIIRFDRFKNGRWWETSEGILTEWNESMGLLW